MKINPIIVTAGIAGILCVSDSRVLAQGGPGGGNFDPAQMQQQFQQGIMDFYREQLEVKDDAEWKVIQARVQKVIDARMEIGLGGMNMGMLGRMMGRGRGGGGGNGGPGGGRGFGALSRFFGAPGPEEQALQQAIDSNASNAVLKAALEKFNAARKAKQAKLEQAQAELRQVLSIRQETIASLSGLL
jgi:hypothetical protein